MGLFQEALIGKGERRTTKGKEERIESVAEVIERADPQKSIKIVCDPDEIPVYVEGIARGFGRLAKRAK